MMHDRSLAIIPGSDQTRSTAVWHYTDATGLMGMLTKNEIWAHSVSDMNDTSEFLHGWRIIQDAWQTVREASLADKSTAAEVIDELLAVEDTPLLADTFVFSATRRADFLNQWQGYAGRQGYALELRTGLWPTPFVDPAANPVRPEALSPGLMPGWFDVLYKPDEQQQLAERAIQHGLALKMDTQHLVGAIASLFGGAAVRMKHQGFEAEEEVRFVHHRRPDLFEQFRTGGLGIRRYIPLVAAKPAGFTTEKFYRLPVASVMVGPVDESQRQSSLSTLKRFLAATGYEKATARISTLPYRP